MAIYYLATNGNNTNDGSIDAPFETLQYSLSQLVAGDTLYIRGGTYTSGTTTSGGVVKNGAEGNLITISRYQDEEVIFDNCGLSFQESSYLDFFGIIVQNHLDTEINDTRQGFNFYHVRHLTIKRCVVRNIGGSGFRFAICDNVYIEDCDAHDCVTIYGTTTKPGPQVGTGFTMGSDNTEEWRNGLYTLEGCRAWNCGRDGISHGGPCVVRCNNVWVYDVNFRAYAGGFTDHQTAPDGVLVTNSILLYPGTKGFNENSFGKPYFLSGVSCIKTYSRWSESIVMQFCSKQLFDPYILKEPINECWPPNPRSKRLIHLLSMT